MRMINADDLEQALRDIGMLDVIKGDVKFTSAWGVPIIDAEPVRHGKWIKQKYEDTDGSAIDGWECSVCGEGVVWRSDDDINLEKYCYHCGAKMDEVNDD